MKINIMHEWPKYYSNGVFLFKDCKVLKQILLQYLLSRKLGFKKIQT